MTLKLKPIEDQVMVITGASSGIGLCTARMAAKRGARLVLAARNEQALARLCDEINTTGGECIYVTADVGREGDIKKIVDMGFLRKLNGSEDRFEVRRILEYYVGSGR